MNICVLHADEIEEVVPLLLLAEPSEGALRWGLANLTDEVYGMQIDGQWVGAATLRWRGEPAEIGELAITSDRQGQGLGRQFLTWILDEARRRGKAALVVGTSNASVSNIVFYQRCGFRMDHVRANYFRYYRTPRYENGIEVRDLLVFRYDLTAHA